MESTDTGETNTTNSLIDQMDSRDRMSADENTNNNPQTVQSGPQPTIGLIKIAKPIFAQHHLKVLNLSRNKLSELPQSLVTGSPKLEWLDVSDNRLKALPVNIGNWTYLKHVNGAWNKIVKVPMSLTENVNLKYLNLEGNPLGGISYDRLRQQEWNVGFCELFAKEVRNFLLKIESDIEKKTNRFRGQEDPIVARNLQAGDQTVLPIEESNHPNEIEDEVVLPIEEPIEEVNGAASGQSVAHIQEFSETEANTISFSNSSIHPFLASNSNSTILQPFTKAEMEAHFNIRKRKKRTIGPKSKSEPALRKKKSLSMLITEANNPNRIRRFDLLRSFLVMILLAILDVIQVVTYLSCAVFAVIVSLGLLADIQLIRSWMEWFGILKYIPTGVQSGAEFLFSLFGAHFASISIYVPIYRSAPNGFFSACVTLLTAGFRYFLDTWVWRAFYNYIF